MLSTLDQLTSLDLAATVDPIIRSIDPEIRRSSTTAFQVRGATGSASGFRFVLDAVNKRWGFSTIDGSFVPGVTWDNETQGDDFFMRSTVYSSGLDDETEWVARKAHGTKAAPLALGNNSDVLEWEANGYDGVSFTSERATMTLRTSEAWAVGANGMNIAWRVTLNGTAAPYDAMLLQNDGDLDILVGGLEIGNVQVFEADRDLAVSLIPNADSALDVGSPSRRFDQIIGNFHEVYAAAADAVPSSRLQSAALLFGPGGAGALDTRFRRTGVSKAVIDSNTALEQFVFSGQTGFFGVNDFGTTFTPAFPIHVQDGGGIFSTIDIDGYGGTGPQFLGRASAGNPSAPAAVAAAVVLSAFSGAGYDGAGYALLADGGVAVASSQGFTGAAHGTELQFYVTLNGTVGLYAGALLQNDGELDILNGLEIGNVQVFEADRDLAINLIPNVDATLAIGSNSRRWTQVVANQFDIYAAAGDAQPTSRSFDASLIFGPGGAGALDTRMRRTGVSTFTFDNNGAGGATIVPPVDNVGVLGTDALRWNRMRATTIVSGDLELLDEKRKAHWVIREEADCVVFENKITGKKYKAVLEEVV